MRRPLYMVDARDFRERDRDGRKLLSAAVVTSAFRRAGLHHVLLGHPGVVALTGVHPEEVEIISEAIQHKMRRDYRVAGKRAAELHVHDWTKHDPKRAYKAKPFLISNAQAESREVVLFQNRDEVPSLFETVADGIAEIVHPGVETIRAAFNARFGRIPSERDLNAACELPLHLLEAAFRRGSSVEQVMRAVGRFGALAEPRDATVSKGRNADREDGPSLDDLHGLGEAAEWGRSLAEDLLDYQTGRIGWREVDRGVLVYGPPGTGKTTFALALARTCSLPIHVHSLAAWQAAGHLNDLLKQMRKAFSDAKASTPSILFVDELDSFGDRQRLSGHNAQYSREVINGFLECLDGAADREGVVVLGATNFPDLVDPAIKRPGRLDRQIEIPLPDAAARAKILRYHLGSLLPDADLSEISDQIEGASGAEIEQVVREAKRRARKDSRRVMRISDLEASLPPAIVLSKNAFWRGCVHEAGHWVVGRKLAEESGVVPKRARVFRKVRDGARGTTTFERDQGFDRTKESHLAAIVVMLAGAAAEEVILGSRGDGSGGRIGSDLQLATAIATQIELSFGLGDDLVYILDGTASRSGDLLSIDPLLKRRVAATLSECLERARSEVRSRRHEVEECAQALRSFGALDNELARERSENFSVSSTTST
ncbi:AAA family ATPase [Fulvimarina endophytica]|uniref:AAA family ATPase n=1 Tax=Fulvimarina endophytica TaxID=2293836 RepID=A0A371X0G8_9HYPH|nr:AAA family ATPase [Fulvimarina endophytica]RFC62737.1 AAA family ATPase [Fulvimarina endophytica]